MHPHIAPTARRRAPFRPFRPYLPATATTRHTTRHTTRWWPPLPALLLAVLCAVMLLASPVRAEPIPAGAPFPDIAMENAALPDQLAALGLAGQGPWKISDIRPRGAGKSPLLLVEVFSMYCPHCQREAPHMNSLMTLLAASPLKDRLTVIGVGAGNTRMEVDLFRQRYAVTMPLFADPELAAHASLGEPATPHFFLVSLKDRSAPRTLFSRTGRMTSPQAFLDELTAIAKRND